MKRQPIVIVGASLAGGTAAVTLRDEGFDGDIVLIGAESELPYNRPPLSKGYLRGQDRFSDQLVKPAAYYTEQRIELRLGVVATAIDPPQTLVELEGGERVAYDRLLVTTGGRNRTFSAPGATLPGVFQLRTVQDCDRIRAAVAPGRRAVVIGFSFVGSEVSASLCQMGVEVVAIESSRVPLARVLGDEVGKVLAEIHGEKGVELVSEDSVEALEGSVRARDRGRRLRRELGPHGLSRPAGEPQVPRLLSQGLHRPRRHGARSRRRSGRPQGRQRAEGSGGHGPSPREDRPGEARGRECRAAGPGGGRLARSASAA